MKDNPKGARIICPKAEGNSSLRGGSSPRALCKS
jgi:hypothetical protein